MDQEPQPPDSNIPEQLEALAQAAWEMRDKDPTRAQTLIEAQLAQAADNPSGRAVGLIVAAFLAFREERCDVALEIILEAQALFAEEALPLWSARLYNTLGGCNLMLGERELALEAYKKQLTFAQACGVPYEIFTAYHDLGVYFSLAKDNVHALEFYERAREHQPSDAHSRAFLERNLADYYADEGMFDEAKQHAEAALELGRGMVRVVELALNGLIHIATQQGDHGEALWLSKELLEFEISAGLNTAEALLSVARSLLALEESQNALTYLKRALEVLEVGGNKLLLMNCHQLLSDAYKRRGAFEEALAHHERFHAYYEEVFSESSEIKVRSLEIIHRMNSLKQEADRLKQLNDVLKRHNEEGRKLRDWLRKLN